MRRFMMCALLFGFASAAQAQEPTAQAPVEPAASETASAPADEAPAPVVDLDPRNTTAAAIDAATLRAPADVDNADYQDVTAPRNFWWLVGAIVLAGVILAVLL